MKIYVFTTTVVSLFIFTVFNWFFNNIDQASQGREEADLDSVIDLVFTLEEMNGQLPSNEDMKKQLASLGKDRYGNPFLVRLYSADTLIVVVATATGEDGKVGGYGKNSDRVKVVSRP